jgi:hypothetical protein
MANITIKDLISKTNSIDLSNNSTEFGQNLSEKELALKGGGFWDWLGGGWGGAGSKA